MGTQYYGGQAVIEGVMMRGRKLMAVAVRTPQGEIVCHSEPLTARIYTSNWGQWPFVRGLGMLWDALGLGIRALLWSGEVSAQEEGQEKPQLHCGLLLLVGGAYSPPTRNLRSSALICLLNTSTRSAPCLPRCSFRSRLNSTS